MIYRQQGQTVMVISEARGRHGLPPLEAYEWAQPVALVTSGVGKKGGHCNQAQYAVALTPLGIHPPHSFCHKMLWAVPRHLVTVPP